LVTSVRVRAVATDHTAPPSMRQENICCAVHLEGAADPQSAGVANAAAFLDAVFQAHSEYIHRVLPAANSGEKVTSPSDVLRREQQH